MSERDKLRVRVIGCPACAPERDGPRHGPGCEQCDGAGWVWVVPNHLSEDEVKRQIEELTTHG